MHCITAENLWLTAGVVLCGAWVSVLLCFTVMDRLGAYCPFTYGCKGITDTVQVCSHPFFISLWHVSTPIDSIVIWMMYEAPISPLHPPPLYAL